MRAKIWVVCESAIIRCGGNSNLIDSLRFVVNFKNLCNAEWFRRRKFRYHLNARFCDTQGIAFREFDLETFNWLRLNFNVLKTIIYQSEHGFRFNI